jgi:4-amino-4-deoxy-L-arabinose transferase-like glycosyltransferase
VRHSRRDGVILFCLALAVRLLAAWLLTGPPYMDAAYYTVGARQLAGGAGFDEPFLWHYLDDPAGLPHPGFLYWMPFPSLLAAPFATLMPGSFFALQLPFVLLSALLPLVAYHLAWKITGRRRSAWLAGVLTVFSGFFFPYWTLPETFTPFAVFGSVALWLVGRETRGAGDNRRCEGWLAYLLAGLLVGLAHLTRADGVLLLPVVALGPLISSPTRNTQQATSDKPRSSRLVVGHWSLVISHWLLVILGYLLVMGPWFLRNFALIGAPLSPAGAKTLWLRVYDDLFCYGCDLSLSSYVAWGWGNILHSKLSALWINFQRLLAEDGLIFLFPFILVGLYRLRRRPVFVLSSVYLLLAYLLHSVAFTFPGPRGGFFHATAAVLLFLFTAGAEGLEVVVRWAGRRRRWNLRQAQAVFATATMVGVVILSVYVMAMHLPAWRDAGAVYRDVATWLDAQHGSDVPTVMVGNPPSFHYYAGVPAVVVPNGGVQTVLDVCERYGVDYLVLDSNRPDPLDALYEGRVSHPRLAQAVTFEDGRVVVWRVGQ